MALRKTQQTIWEKSRAMGSGAQAVGLDDGKCAYLIATIARDLDLTDDIPGLPDTIPDFFASEDLGTLVVETDDARALFEALVGLDADADMYYACLAALHKARLKYETILQTQPMPTLEQVGPRGLLQYGKLSPKALAAFLFWRKWFFDIDNRAGQETGYLFEPVIAYAIGGTPVPASKSPVKRHRDPRKGRQIDCLLGKKAYELKIRVTIAASGQGRWREELDYPVDCRTSGYTPVLLVLDGTPNPKLEELERAFLDAKGEAYKGTDAWVHLDSLAGETMSRFLDKYIRGPVGQLIQEASGALPEMTASMSDDAIVINIGGETLHIARRPILLDEEEPQELANDASDEIVA